jgi:hypothetical protein
LTASRRAKLARRLISRSAADALYQPDDLDFVAFCFAGERIACCTIVITDVNELTRPTRDRMPVVLDKADAASNSGEGARLNVGCGSAKYTRALIAGAVVAATRYYRDAIRSRERYGSSIARPFMLLPAGHGQSARS